jgi:hypothetical protein
MALNCEVVQELTKMTSPQSTLIARGGHSDVFVVNGSRGQDYILKVRSSGSTYNKFRGRSISKGYTDQLQDAMVSQHLAQYLSTAKHIISMLGWCNGTTVQPFYPNGDVESLRTSGKIRQLPLTRIKRLMVDAAKAVEALHMVPGGPIRFNDVSTRQVGQHYTSKHSIWYVSGSNFPMTYHISSC